MAGTKVPLGTFLTGDLVLRYLSISKHKHNGWSNNGLVYSLILIYYLFVCGE